MSHIGQNIKRIRAVRGLSQAKFAELFNLARPSVGAYEEGRSEPKIQTVVDMAHYFGISIDVLLTKELTVKDLYSLNMVNKKMDHIHAGLVEDKVSSDVKSVKVVFKEEWVNYLVNHNKKDYINSLPVCNVPISSDKRMRLFQMNGDGMSVDKQGILHGDFVLGEFVSLDKVNNLSNDEPILVITNAHHYIGRPTIEESLSLEQDNPNFDSTQVDINEVLEVWQLKAKWSTHLHRPKKLADKVSDVESQLLQLMKRVDSMENSKDD